MNRYLEVAVAVAAAFGYQRTQVWVNRVDIEVSGSVVARGGELEGGHEWYPCG